MFELISSALFKEFNASLYSLLAACISDNINQMSEDEITEFEALLNSEDPDVYKWIVKFEVPNDKSLNDIIIKIREYLKVNQINVLS